MSYTFPKSNRLGGALAVQQLHREGKHFVVWPLRVSYLPITDNPSPVTDNRSPLTVTKVVIWAPKRLFKHAVDRNRLKRLMREAYRLNQNILTSNFLIAFTYMDKEKQSFAVIEKAMCKALEKINGKS